MNKRFVGVAYAGLEISQVEDSFFSNLHVKRLGRKRSTFCWKFYLTAIFRTQTQIQTRT